MLIDTQIQILSNFNALHKSEALLSLYILNQNEQRVTKLCHFLVEKENHGNDLILDLSKKGHCIVYLSEEKLLDINLMLIDTQIQILSNFNVLHKSEALLSFYILNQNEQRVTKLCHCLVEKENHGNDLILDLSKQGHCILPLVMPMRPV